MKKEVIGQITPEEKNVIQALFERRNGLVELSKALTADNSDLYEKIVIDISETSTKFHEWWNSMAEKYHWKRVEGGNWEVNFETNEIILITK